MAAIALVTGFEPYGGREINPSAEVVKHLDGLEIAGTRVCGRVLPVSMRGIGARVRTLLEEVEPAAVVSLGLSPAEPVIRLERVAVNVAHFDIPDNEGEVFRDDLVEPGGATALTATLPLSEILRALLRAGIPARLSTTAGTYLCNATMYSFLRAAERIPGAISGFIHLPCLPEQVAGVLEAARLEPGLEEPPPSALASMSLTTMLEAVRIALRVSLTTRAA